jgi:hypothetical protein
VSENPGLNQLAERKRLLVEQAQLHRSALLFEQLQWRDRIAAANAQVQSPRWLLTRRLGGFTRWLPMALSVARIAQGLRK